MTDTRREREVKRIQMARDNGLRLLLSDPDGRAFLWGLLELAGVARISAARDNGNGPMTDFLPYATFFNEGQRNLGNIVLAKVLDLDPNAYGRMMIENRVGRIDDPSDAVVSDEE